MTRLVAHMVDESFDWESSVGAVLPNLEALTLIASDFQPGFSLGPPLQSRPSVLEDLYVQSLPGVHCQCAEGRSPSHPFPASFCTAEQASAGRILPVPPFGGARPGLL